MNAFQSRLHARKQALAPFFEKPVLANYLFGITSGFPLTLVISFTALWLARYGVDRTTIGVFALATSFYAWKFLWAPLMDRLDLKPVTGNLGRRKGWLFALLVLMAGAVLYLSELNPRDHIVEIGVTISLIGFLSASLDIVIGAFRIEILKEDQYGHAASMHTLGYRSGNFLVGYVALSVAFFVGYAVAIKLIALLLLPGLIAAIWVGEPAIQEDDFFKEEHKRVEDKSRALQWLYEAVFLPFKEFLRRDRAILILLFIFLFKIGDAVTAVMTSPLIVELGFTELEIANWNKLVGQLALFAGITVGSVLYFRLGIYRSLFVTGVLMMATNLVFAWLATRGHDVYALGITIGAENFAAGLGDTVVVAYLTGLCNKSFTATQYALLSSLASQGRAILGAFSGAWATSLGWVDFFIFATFLAVPGLLVLGFLWYKDVGENG